MAGKQLGKLRQLVTEAISSKDKTVVTDEFRELEHDIELRREGIQRLSIASKDFDNSLMKKRDSEAVNEPEKLLPIDALGLVMITHGEEFGEESAYGSSLVRFGRAHCKIATLQEAMGLTFRDTFCHALSRYEDEIIDYQAQRKKLESRRLSYEAAMTKLDGLKKNKKTKEKELYEAEDDLARTKQRYEETSEDVRTRMYAIQENELAQLRDLTAFLELELNFYHQAVEVLKDTKEGWHDESSISHVDRPRPTGPTHSFSRPVEDTGSARSSPKITAPKSPKLRSKRSQRLDSGSDSDAADEANRSRKSSFSLAGRKNSVRKRSDSTATAASGATEKEEREKDKSGKRMTMTGWGMSWGNKSGAKNRDKFASLRGSEDAPADASDDDDDNHGDGDDGTRSSKSARARSGKSPKATPALLRSSSAPLSGKKKRVLGLFDYVAAADDELSFRQGDELAVLNEVSDTWWMGELRGKRGLFPISYVSVLDGKRPPVLPRRPAADADDPAAGYAGDTSRLGADDTDTDAASVAEDSDHPFGDHLLVTHRTPVYANFDAHSVESSAAEDTEEEGAEERPVLSKKPEAGEQRWRPSPSAPAPPKLPSRTQTGGSSPSISSVSSASPSVTKKAPPPPPPPRRPSTLGASSSSLSFSNTPPKPPRNAPPPASRSTSSAGLQPSLSARAAAATVSPTESPFDSSTDLTGGGDCKEFKQNPFKPKGMCANCFLQHG